MPASIENIVRVTAIIAEAGLLRREFGIALFLTKDTTLGTGADSIQTFVNAEGVDSVFDTGTEPQLAGNIWFQQSPAPKNLIVGRFFDSASNALLFGGVHGTLAQFTAITDGSFIMNGETISALDFSSAASLADVAGVLQTALQAATDANLTNSTVIFNAAKNRFEIDNEVPGVGSTLTVATPTGSGTDVSILTGWSQGLASIHQGVEAETVPNALSRLLALSTDWYFVTVDSDFTDDEKTAVKDWVEARAFMFAAESSDTQALVTGENTSLFAQFDTDQVARTFGDWTPSTDPYLAVSSVARLSSVNFNQSNSLINPAFKSRPGITPAARSILGPTQRVELDRKRVNYFTEFGTDASYQTGAIFKTGVWQDVRYWLDWFVNAVRVAEYNLLRASVRVPQTDQGHTAILNAITSVCLEGINNGGIAPGQLSDALTLDVQQATGVSDFDGFLTNGYLIYYTDLTLQSQTDRDNREASPFRVWLKGSGAINSIDIAVTFEN